MSCQSEIDCTSQQTCINRKCQNPCAVSNPCTQSQDCQVQDHQPVCVKGNNEWLKQQFGVNICKWLQFANAKKMLIAVI